MIIHIMILPAKKNILFLILFVNKYLFFNSLLFSLLTRICFKMTGIWVTACKNKRLKTNRIKNKRIQPVIPNNSGKKIRNPFVHNTGSRIISTNVVRWINRIYLFHNRGKRKLNAISARAAGKKKISIVDTFWLGTLIYGV